MGGQLSVGSPPAGSRWPGNRRVQKPRRWPRSARSCSSAGSLRARPLLETLLQLQPEHPEALYNLGVLASEEGRLEEARLLLRRAVMAN
jgi:tetratricopeptide (TPR) repeat protein